MKIASDFDVATVDEYDLVQFLSFLNDVLALLVGPGLHLGSKGCHKPEPLRNERLYPTEYLEKHAHKKVYFKWLSVKVRLLRGFKCVGG